RGKTAGTYVVRLLTGSRLADLETPEGGTRSSSHRAAGLPARVVKVAVVHRHPSQSDERARPSTARTGSQAMSADRVPGPVSGPGPPGIADPGVMSADRSQGQARRCLSL